MSVRLEKGLQAMRAQVDARVVSFMSTCVHCGICAEACLFFTETGDPKYTPIRKVEHRQASAHMPQCTQLLRKAATGASICSFRAL